MENEKIVEEKNVEKKPKRKIGVIDIIFIILGIAVSGIIIEQYNATKPTPQTGSQYVGVYKYVEDLDLDKDYEEDYELFEMELCEDGSVKDNSGSKVPQQSWQETENGFTITDFPGTKSENLIRYVETSTNCYRLVLDDGTYITSEHYEKQ